MEASTVKSEVPAVYLVKPDIVEEDQIIEQAKAILTRRLQHATISLNAPDVARDYLVLHYAALDHEEFGVIWLDAQNRVLHAESMFKGSLTQTAVYPREVVKAALRWNASAAVIYHNHPSGMAEPSPADEFLTRALKDALAMVDVKVLDHFIVAGAGRPMSFAERGLI